MTLKRPKIGDCLTLIEDDVIWGWHDAIEDAWPAGDHFVVIGRSEETEETILAHMSGKKISVHDDSRCGHDWSRYFKKMDA